VQITNKANIREFAERRDLQIEGKTKDNEEDN